MANNEFKSKDVSSLSIFDRIIRNLFFIGALFLFISFLLMLQNKHHFYFSYLTSFSFYLTISLGALFFVLIQFVTRAGWSVVVRRIPELLMNNIFLLMLFFIPLLFGLGELYHWMHPEEVMHDPLLQGKKPYLNGLFFCLRLFLYFSVWGWLSKTFFSKSVSQDSTGDGKQTLEMQKMSTYGLILFAFTLTFGFIDLVMSLTPHWYSTIFGVYMFAGAVLVSLCVTSLLYMVLRRYGLLKSIVTLEHYHDLGKLIYGFNIFWSYIAFSQFFLIWYANVPEETVFYVNHFAGSWTSVTTLLILGHFAVPFLFFMSRHAKRHLGFHAGMALWLVFMHFVDLYWIIMPTVSPKGFHFDWMDLTTLIGLGGIYFAVFFFSMKKVSLIPMKDPRLSESLQFHNT